MRNTLCLVLSMLALSGCAGSRGSGGEARPISRHFPQPAASATPAPLAPEPGDPKFGEYVYVEELPEMTHRVEPVYPPALAGKGVSGTVMVQALVGRDGRVHDARIVNSIPGLDTAALEAARQCEFKPARTKGEPVAAWVAIPFTFAAQ